MGFFSNIRDSVRRKADEIKDRREFLDLVEQEAKPIRRKAYLEQMKKEVIKEGIEKAKVDSKKRIPQQQKSRQDFGISDPFKYLNPKEKKK